MPRATTVLREKIVDERGNILELVIWRVPTARHSPSGVRYRLAVVRRDDEKPVVLYDNHSPKGHHRHLEGIEQPYAFVGVDQLLADFMADVRRVMGDDRWPGR
jgi:hypothetical protein